MTYKDWIQRTDNRYCEDLDFALSPDQGDELAPISFECQIKLLLVYLDKISKRIDELEKRIP